MKGICVYVLELMLTLDKMQTTSASLKIKSDRVFCGKSWSYKTSHKLAFLTKSAKRQN